MDMASASRSTESPSAPIELRVFNWSAALDVLRGTVDLLEQNPSFLDDYDRDEVFDVYQHVAEAVESQIEVGDSWRRIITIELTTAQLRVVTGVLSACDANPEAYDELPDTLPDLTSLARDIAIQHEARR